MEVDGRLTSESGGGSYDRNDYWFESRKRLDSGDRYDWMLEPGQIVGDEPPSAFFVNGWDDSQRRSLKHPVNCTPISKVS